MPLRAIENDMEYAGRDEIWGSAGQREACLTGDTCEE
jgi:hypothetical protein